MASRRWSAGAVWPATPSRAPNPSGTCCTRANNHACRPAGRRLAKTMSGRPTSAGTATAAAAAPASAVAAACCASKDAATMHTAAPQSVLARAGWWASGQHAVCSSSTWRDSGRWAARGRSALARRSARTTASSWPTGTTPAARQRGRHSGGGGHVQWRMHSPVTHTRHTHTHLPATPAGHTPPASMAPVPRRRPVAGRPTAPSGSRPHAGGPAPAACPQ